MPANTPNGFTYPLYTDSMVFTPAMQDLATDVDTFNQNTATQIASVPVRPSTRISSTALQAVATMSLTLANFSTGVVDFDNAGQADLANNRITITTSGVYLLQSNVRFNAVAPAAWGMLAFFNSDGGFSAVPARQTIRGIANRDTHFSFSALHYVAPATTDHITVTVHQNSGVSQNIQTRSLSVTKVSALQTDF
jgi:hypothetical protein